MLNDMAKNLILWVVIVLVLMSVFQTFTTNNTQSAAMNYSDFIAQVNDGNIESVEIDQYGRTISGRLSSGESFSTVAPADDQLVSDLLKNNVQIKAEAPEVASIWQSIFVNLLPIFLLLGIWIFFMRQMQGGGAGRGAMSFGKSRARMLTEDQVKVTFADVAGADEAKEEVVEMVDFLRDPSKFQKLGGKIPKGVLMVGSPGTGKTLLARAIAGEAKVPFFTISGSDFVEMFVGVGASRVRDMFEQVKKHAPCIIFIDEIDAVGRHRGAGLGGGHDEREQTLNQLLVEMDGFEGNEGVIVIAGHCREDMRRGEQPGIAVCQRKRHLRLRYRDLPQLLPRGIQRMFPSGFCGFPIDINKLSEFLAKSVVTNIWRKHIAIRGLICYICGHYNYVAHDYVPRHLRSTPKR